MSARAKLRGRVFRTPDIDISTVFEVAFIPGGWAYKVYDLRAAPGAFPVCSGVRGSQPAAFAACERAIRRWYE